MEYSVSSIPNFEKQYKKLAKKHVSLFEDVAALVELLKRNPIQGSALGNGLYKIRLPIASKSKGKSGGGRVISCVKIIENKIILVAIYDKSMQETMTSKELNKLLNLIP